MLESALYFMVFSYLICLFLHYIQIRHQLLFAHSYFESIASYPLAIWISSMLVLLLFEGVRAADLCL